MGKGHEIDNRRHIADFSDYRNQWQCAASLVSYLFVLFIIRKLLFLEDDLRSEFSHSDFNYVENLISLDSDCGGSLIIDSEGILLHDEPIKAVV